jgi:hypothetical protein
LEKFRNDKKIFHDDGYIIVVNRIKHQPMNHTIAKAFEYQINTAIRAIGFSSGFIMYLDEIDSYCSSTGYAIALPSIEPEPEKEELFILNDDDPDPEIPVRFKKPTADEVSEYATSIGFVIDGNDFVNYYESKGWMIGKNKMKDWRAAVRTWKINKGKYGKQQKLESSEYDTKERGFVPPK